MDYSFDIKMATEIGVEKAVLLKNIVFWIRKNEANKKNYFDGSYWTYNSANAFTKLFPFWSAKKIYNMLKWLTNNDYLKEGNYNKVAYDRTKWYALSEKSITYYRQFHFTKSSNGIDQMVKPIPDINPNNKPDINTDKSKEEKEVPPKSRIPKFEEFEKYALEKKPTVDKEALRLKYESWVESDWHTGGDKPRKIKNWKTTLSNTLPYMKESSKMSEWEKLNKGWR